MAKNSSKKDEVFPLLALNNNILAYIFLNFVYVADIFALNLVAKHFKKIFNNVFWRQLCAKYFPSLLQNANNTAAIDYKEKFITAYKFKTLVFKKIDSTTTALTDVLQKHQEIPLDFTNSLGQTPLYLAVKNGIRAGDHVEKTKIILRHKQNIDALSNGETALMHALENGDVGNAELLLKKGANFNILRNSKGKTAEDIAIEKSNGMLKVIEKYHKPEAQFSSLC